MKHYVTTHSKKLLSFRMFAYLMMSLSGSMLAQASRSTPLFGAWIISDLPNTAAGPPEMDSPVNLKSQCTFICLYISYIDIFVHTQRKVRVSKNKFVFSY